MYDATHVMSSEQHRSENHAIWAARHAVEPKAGMYATYAFDNDHVVVPFNLSAVLQLHTLPPYTAGQRGDLLRRFERLNSDRLLGPMPTLSIGRSLFCGKACASVHPGEVHGYGNGWQDIYLYTHLFSRPTPVLNGVYVEIGGNDGMTASNTLFFEQHLNWTGVLIEPNPCGQCVLPTIRPRDRVVHAGACALATSIPSASPHFKDLKRRGFCHGSMAACKPPGQTVPCLPMRELLQPLPSHIDLFVIDVEANVMDVLQTIPWHEVQIDVLLVEPTGKPGAHIGVQVVRYLVQQGYILLSPHFGGDYVAVRAACFEHQIKGRIPSTIWWAKFFSKAENARLGYLQQLP